MRKTNELVDFISRIPVEAGREDYNRWLGQLVEESESTVGVEHEQLYQLATMLLYEMYPEGAARKMAHASAELDLIPPIYRKLHAEGWSYNEVFFSRQMTYDKFDERIFQLLPHSEDKAVTMDEGHPLARFFKDLSGVFILSKENKVCAYRDRMGFLVLVGWTDESDYIVADEDNFLDEPPLWFTDHNHFRSPVWQMKKVRRSLLDMMFKTDMARVPIRCELILTKDGDVLNREDMKEAWSGLSLSVYNSDKMDDPLDAMSFDELPLQHLWQHLYDRADAAAFSPETPF